jgi:hypothetical protein
MVELLAIVASYATREDHDGLHDGHTVSIGRPWVEGAEADHLYFNKPYFVSGLRHAADPRCRQRPVPVACPDHRP